MRISDWSSDVCSSDLLPLADGISTIDIDGLDDAFDSAVDAHNTAWFDQAIAGTPAFGGQGRGRRHIRDFLGPLLGGRSEEHTSELQSLMRISYAVFCLKTKRTYKH